MPRCSERELGRVLDALGLPTEFVLQEVAAMGLFGFAKTASRSLGGSMEEFAFMLEHARERGRSMEDVTGSSVWLARTPCGLLRTGDGFPDRAVASVVARTLGT